MASDALPVPADLKPLLEKHPGLDWAGIAWDSVRAHVGRLERAEAIARRSALKRAQAKALVAALREA